MDFMKRRKSILYTFLVMTLLPASSLLLYNCSGGSSSYSDTPATVQQASQVMISPATLNNWVVNGYGTDSTGYNKLVILDVDSASTYASRHIPGSYNLDTGSDLYTTRSDGVAFTVSQVATKEMMDALIQRTGIDDHTVIALVGNGSLMNVGRAYFNFRYWGFPKERLKVLDGTKDATYVTAAGYTLTAAVTPDPTPSTYSVAQLTTNVSVRASMEEMIGYAGDSDPFTVIIDSRSDDEYNGVIRKTKVDSSVPNYVAFEGHVLTAEHQEYKTLQVGGGSANPLLPKDELIAAMAAINVDEDSTGISYCRTSWRATLQFLALDAVLGWNAKIYDGAWIEWGQMASNDPAYDGSLEPDSPWITSGLTESLTYNKKIVAPISGANSTAANANEINETDKAVCGAAGTFPNDRSVDVMISPADLLDWVDNGLPNNGVNVEPYNSNPYTKVVVLHVDYSQANYDAGHVPGAFFMSVDDLSTTRDNGIADTVSQVATDGMMDDLIQRTGIDADTVVVFTTSPGNYNMMNLGRAYFNFRYWGFTKESLRILDGNTTTHYAAVDTLSTVTPAPVISTYSVCDLRQDNSVDEVRASFEEMFDVAQDSD
ncbi:MAG: selenite/tellurite reduction operon rhodanese-like protein ExtH, partial [Desulfobulbaceae bacterium]|nr:selenite/tellurite reduction operon rhodanese-like protein ExtH [Desulfobulbaceae bacterium]